MSSVYAVDTFEEEYLLNIYLISTSPEADLPNVAYDDGGGPGEGEAVCQQGEAARVKQDHGVDAALAAEEDVVQLHLLTLGYHELKILR